MTTGHERRCAELGVAIALGQVGLAAPGVAAPLLAGVPAVAAVGLAAVPTLPARVRERPLAAYALVLPVGALVLDLAIISIAAAGVPLTRGSIAVLVLLLAGLGLLAAARQRAAEVEWSARDSLPAAIGGVLGTLVAVLFAVKGTGGSPPSGNDWAKYVLYADEIRRQHGLLIDNPYWLLGVPFREDPGAPALIGGLLALTGAPAPQAIYALPAIVGLGALGVFGAAAALYGRRAAVAGVAVLAIVPANADMASWHGLANFWGLAIVPLAALAAGLLLRGDRSWATCALAGGALVGVAAAHRLTLLIVVAAGAVLFLPALVRRPREALAVVVRVGLCGAAAGALVAVDLLSRSDSSGGVQSYKAYLDTKVAWSLVTRDMTWALIAAGGLGLAAIAAALVRRRGTVDGAFALGPALALAAVGYGYAWVVHIPGFYVRATYFLPIALALVVAAGVAALDLRGRALAAGGVVLAALLLASALPSRSVISGTHNYYAWTDAGALRGWDLLSRSTGPRSVVVTDRCTSFQSTWLLHRPVLAALAPSDIGPAAELERVTQARMILAGGPGGRLLRIGLGARYAVINPTCPGTGGRPPADSRLLYVSRFLAIFALKT